MGNIRLELETFSHRGLTIPERMHGGIIRYIENRTSPGSFLMAVILNDLKEACAYADDENAGLLHVYVSFFYNRAPSQCWGSPERVTAWLNNGIYPND